MKSLSSNDIHFVIKYLKDVLPSKPTTVEELYSLPKQYDYSFNGPVSQKEEALQNICDHMGDFLGVKNKINVYFVEKSETGIKTNTIYVDNGNGNISADNRTEYVEEEKYAGLYKVKGYDHGEIVIVNDKTFYLIHFLSVLAHEVTHNYLYHHKINPPNNYDSEIMTDLAAIYLGFGAILLHGYEPSTAIKYRLGYIDVPTIKKAIIESYMVRKWKIKNIVNQFQWFEGHRYYFQLFLYPRSAYKKCISVLNKKQGNVDSIRLQIINCNSCGQKLRIPNKEVTLKVTCPKCKNSFIIG